MKTLQKFNEWFLTESREFDINELKKLKKTIEIENYCLRVLGDMIGSGDARNTWAIDKDSVIKVARRRGVGAIEQNETEVRNAECLGPEYAVRILDHDPNFRWIIAEKLQQITDNEFNELLALKLGVRVFWNKLNYMIKTFIRGDTIVLNNLPYEPTKWFIDFATRLNNCKTAFFDFHPGNWGIRPATNELVVLDLGF
jgi:hypothetical protein